MKLHDLTPKAAEVFVEKKFNQLRKQRQRAIITHNSGAHSFAPGAVVRLVFNRRYTVLHEVTGAKKRVIGWEVIGPNAVSGKQTRQTVLDNEIKILKNHKGAINK